MISGFENVKCEDDKEKIQDSKRCLHVPIQNHLSLCHTHTMAGRGVKVQVEVVLDRSSRSHGF